LARGHQRLQVALQQLPGKGGDAER
jgi:hypothetical protein